MRCSKSSSKGEAYSNTGLLQETRNVSNKQFNVTSTGTRKEEQSPKLVKERNNKDHRGNK